MTEETAEQKLKRYEYVLDAQADEIDKLRAEVERLRSAAGAHGVLKSIYLNGELPEGLRAKAAASAIVHEVPKLMPERAPLELQAEPVETLFEQADRRMRKQLPLVGQQIEVQPNGAMATTATIS
jgi:hypothetical protein